jgi:exopolysaccharide biosynthesis polyprenyl glycosylphosphotransferase
LTLEAAALLGVLVVLLLEKYGEYRPYLSLLAVRETERMLRVGAECLLMAVPLACVSAAALPRTLILTILAAVPAFLIAEKSALRGVVRALRSSGYGNRRAVILGAGPLAKNIYSVLLRSPKLGLTPVAIVDEEAAGQGKEIHASSYGESQSALVLAGPLTKRLFQNMDASVLVIADPDVDDAERQFIMQCAGSLGVSTYVVSRDYMEPGYWLEYSEIDGMMLAQVRAQRRLVVYESCKRALDLGVAAAFLVALLPLFALIALLICMTSDGPAMFRQLRVGEKGKLFHLHKFRSMYQDSPPYALSPTSGHDNRITPVGRFLRMSCLDELPQLWNVLRGDMSLVGPRPEMPFLVERYTPLQRERLAVKPGITGLWQLSGDRKRLIHENLEYDLYYIRNRNLFMDFAVLLHTVVFAARGI